MRPSVLIIALLVLMPAIGYGQLQIIYGEPFDSLRNLASEKYQLEEYEESAQLYDEAYEVLNDSFPCNLFYLDAFVACNRSKRIDRSVYYLKKYSRLGILNDSQYLKLTEGDHFAELRFHSEWQAILNRIEKKREEFGAIYYELLRIDDSDQTLRLLLECAENNLQNNNQKKYLWNLIAREDSLNLLYIDSIINLHGWLGIYKVGEDGSSAMWKVIQHSSLDVQEKYLPIIRESVMKGETSRVQLAFLEDRINLYRGRYQIYGTQVVRDDDGNYRVFPVQDPSNVNEIRRELGFEPLAEYLGFWDIVIESEADLQLDHLLKKWEKI